VIEKCGRVGNENGGMIKKEIPASEKKLYVWWKQFRTRGPETVNWKRLARVAAVRRLKQFTKEVNVT
jgi:hypothetical protein